MQQKPRKNVPPPDAICKIEKISVNGSGKTESMKEESSEVAAEINPKLVQTTGEYVNPIQEQDNYRNNSQKINIEPIDDNDLNNARKVFILY